MVVTSYGIALVKKNKINNRYEILFIKKRITYAYITFVKGIYNKNNDNELIKLFNNMTIEEKISIMSLNFNNIWYMSYLTIPHNLIPKDLSKYESCKHKFEKRFLNDNGKRLLKLLKNTKNINSVWEIPKGMQNKNEQIINTAIREFSEETGIKKNKYKLLWDVPPLEYVFNDENVTYKYVYYVGIMLDHKYVPNIELDINKSTIMESSDIKFINMDEIKLLTNNNLAKFVSKIFNIAKNYIHFKK